MLEFKQILCPVDFSESSERALVHAAALARWYEAHLAVLHVVPTPDVIHAAGSLVEPPVPMPREQALENMKRSIGTTALPPGATLVAESGDPRATILDQATSRKTDLIVMGTHGRRGFKRLLLGSVTEAVLHEAPCPVLTVPPHAPVSASQAVGFKRILCPIDFSPSSVDALGCALDLARQADGRVTLLHVLEWLPEEQFTVPDYMNQIVEDARARLRSLIAGESRTWVEIDDDVVFGRPHREILRAAEARPPDLIVMGAQGRGGIGLALFGSTTQQIVRLAACPVLTVRALRHS